MIRRLVAVLAAATLAASTLACTDRSRPAPTPAPTEIECLDEDSTGPCYWDATKHGNGTGRSFRIDQDGNVHYEEGK